MSKFLQFGLALLFIPMMLFSCKKPIPKDLNQENLIPKPVSLTATGSSFEWTKNTQINIQTGKEEVREIAAYLADFIAPSTGFKTEIKELKKPLGSRGISLIINENQKDLGEEGYNLIIESKKITLEAFKPEGIFRGVQTIRQLLPAKIESDSLQKGPWLIASGTIMDYPQYGYRGAMLDVVRHFFGIEDVKQYIDYLAAYKMNVLHLHLSDDQGWRIEIKSWPKLTEIGGKTQVGGGKGGYYTQEEYQEIVQYAKERYITIIPEIDMPGHTNAALASYAELNADNKACELYTGTRVGFSTLATDKEITYQFVDDVIRELAAITPGEYIHIGGDESHVTKKKDYIKFVNRVQKIVQSHGKKMMGWADVAAASLDESSVAQFWQTKPENAVKAVKQNVKVIMSPASLAYMDMQYDSLCPLGLHWAGFVPVDKAYNWTLESIVEGIAKKDILGIEAPLWTETVETMDDIEFLVFPRLPGYAELGWSPVENHSWDEYKFRLGMQQERFEFMNINYYKSELIPWQVLKNKELK
ncbi:beta-N-acetylhexosaminidase [Labilibaculum antarcticum]|uniref:beta-N-acetylhexosaminidase n=1 Tax=Labilibaculum antarcticum TaxID=1717717 RepID=A0A1Y1CF50_9BACT|nr:beta-N-acetylhexosaminidase [Labilibaculum antarcticum]BAX78955.1 beta-N-acetylhexosaminidase [Labilibaculum antarcticum]